MTIDIDTALADGSRSPSSVFSEIDSLIDLGTVVDLGTIKKNYNAMTGVIADKKNVYGKFKEPVPARISILDMNTAEYVVTSTKFLLTGVRREKREKFQILRGFGEEWLLSVFGKDVAIYGITGTLINLHSDKASSDDGKGADWVRDFDELYDIFMRAYILVQKKYQVVLHYSNRLIRGYVIGKVENDNSENQTFVNFSMNILVRKDKMY